MSEAPAPRARASTLAALAELRMLLTWRRLRGRGGVGELVARTALLVMAVPAGIAFAIAAGAGAFRTVRAQGGLQLAVGASALFLGVWLTWTVVALTLSDRESFELRRLLVYPVRPAQAYAYELVASAVGDPFVLFWSLLLAGAFVGAGLARPGPWLILLAGTHLLFFAAMTAQSALLQELLARALRMRRAREVGVTAIYVGFFLLLAWGGGRGLRGVLHALRAVASVRWIAYPAALAGEATTHLYTGRVIPALAWLAGLAGAVAATTWVAYRLAIADAMSGSEGVQARGAAGGAGWRLPGRAGPLLEKELKYLLRHPLATVLCLVVPAISAVVGWKLVPFIPEDAGEVVRALPLMGLALYAQLVTQAFWLNAFGWDRGGAGLWFLAPLDPADVLRAKNASVQLLSLVIFAASAGALVAAGGAPPAWALLAAAALHVGVGSWFLAAGNVVSILNPRAAAYSLQRGGGLSSLSMLAGMGIVSAGTALFVPAVFLALHFEEPWLLPASWAVLAAAGAAVHRAALPATARLLGRRREELLAALVE